MPNRRDERELPVWVGWIGDMSTMNNYLHKKPWISPWVLVKTINTVLRAIGVVAFANNPFTGLLILIGMFMGDLNVAIACILCGSLATMFSLFLRANAAELRDGVCVFNSILTGCIISAVVPPILGVGISLKIWIIMGFAAVVCCYVDQGLNIAMSVFKLPGQSLPFNITAAMLFLVIKGYLNNHIGVPDNLPPIIAANVSQEINWSKVLEGSVLAAGQVYGVGTIDSSIMVWLGFLLYSPLLTFNFFIGSVIGTIGGVFVTGAPYAEVYLGLWGYNSMLACGGTSFFLVPSPFSFVAGIFCSVLAFITQAALSPIFAVNLVPVFSYPFNVAIFLVLAISTREGSNLIFINDRTFHELHIYKYYILKERRQEISTLDMNKQDLEQPLNVYKTH